MTKTVPNAPNAPNIALIAYEGSQLSAVLGLCDLFTVANRSVQAQTDRQIVPVVLEGAPDPAQARYDAVVLPPNLSGARGQGDTALHGWIAQQHRAGAVLCSACAGAFWLARAGILDGRPATTHWALEQQFRSNFPAVDLHPEHILLDDNDIITAGGVMAWTDLGLALVRRYLGAEAVSQTCRQMLIDPTGREQRTYRSFRPDLTHGDAAIREVQLWIAAHLPDDLSLEGLAARAGLATRSFQRRFAQRTGHSVTHYVQELRIEKAKHLLEVTTRPISEICYSVGYVDVSAFSRLFKSITGVSAGDYRKRFCVV